MGRPDVDQIIAAAKIHLQILESAVLDAAAIDGHPKSCQLGGGDHAIRRASGIPGIVQTEGRTDSHFKAKIFATSAGDREEGIIFLIVGAIAGVILYESG